MANWQEPIYDRTQDDIDYAKQKLREWRITPPETYVDLKGCFNVSDINRIEQNSEYLKDYLNSIGYQIYFQNAPKYDWNENDLPIQNDITRIVNNVQKLKDNFLPSAEWLALPTTIENYENVNIIELWLYDMKYLTNYIINRYCDTFSSGQDFFLPLG